MQEIEISSRLYIERRALHDGNPDVPVRQPTCPDHGGHFHPLRPPPGDGALRRAEAFALVENKLARACPPGITGEMVLMELLDAVIDRCADILERCGSDIDNVSHDIFEPESERHGQAKQFADPGPDRAQGRFDLQGPRKPGLDRPRRHLHVGGDGRHQMVQGHARAAQDHAARRRSLTDHASYLSNKITFVLDAMLGVVNLEQNNIIKLFSVMAVVLMPPTLIASIYGMNFKIMPELEWVHGYPMALIMMLAAAIVPYWIFKWKKWL